jgi:L,D-peptidoglycan transpeptidase YkuD (ErfK/YbiS/YcfS/YnhG family)
VKLYKFYIKIKKSFSPLVILFFLSACVFMPTAIRTIPIENLTYNKNETSESKQILLVTNDNPLSITAEVHVLEKVDAKWIPAFDPLNAVIGEKGFAPLDEKREGDSRTPSGIFPLQITFGYNETIRTKMPYRQALSDDLWIDDIDAVDYNKWVKKKESNAVSYEVMKRKDNLYKYGIVIEYNTNPVIKGYGSAIFMHVWGGRNVATSGCVAVSEEDILRILEWLDPTAKPLIIMGTKKTIWRSFQ